VSGLPKNQCGKSDEFLFNKSRVQSPQQLTSLTRIGWQSVISWFIW
jgi:hypothetical protein